MEQVIKASHCHICKKPLAVKMVEETICVDGSTWFEKMLVVAKDPSYLVVEGIDCLGVAVCLDCGSDINKLRRSGHVDPRTTITINSVPIGEECNGVA